MIAGMAMVIPYIAGFLAYILGGRKPISHLLAAISLIASVALVLQLQVDQTVSLFGFYLELTSLGKLVVLFTFAIALAMVFHSWEVPQVAGFLPCLCFVTGSILSAQLSADLFLTSAFLLLAALSITYVIPQTPPTERSIQVATKYLSMVAVAGFLIIGALLIIKGLDVNKETMVLVKTVVALLAAGIAVLVAAAPLHLWLPDVSEHSTSMVTALSVCLISIAAIAYLLGLLDRFTWLLSDPASVFILQLGSVLTTILGAILALTQERLGKMIAYTAIHSIGYTLLGITLGSGQVVMAAIFLLMVQSLTLFVLLLAAGNIVFTTGTDKISQLRGIGRYSPIATTAFFVGGLAISGYPPLSGFAGRWLVYLSIAETNTILAFILLAASGLTLLTYVRTFHTMFFGMPDLVQRRREPLISTYVVLVICVAIGVLGLFPNALFNSLGSVIINLSFVKLM